ncbi:amino acid ABC transporter permease [Microvirga aerophila]|uniref:ABC transporter permease n=1 Tax=Microvirga aerophila TaxID=670291 RepID=A0A512C4C8_9HYPH|nr:amino acid ABC transporter permease [Microvirga aerophila]GEO18917.1 ABC transporter permease [Microvirga aerophila]
MEFDFSPLLDSWRFLASGLGLTILLSIAAVISSLVLGLAVGLGRLYGPTWLSAILVFYIDSMRAIPVFVVLVWIYFAVPIISGHTFAPFWAALTGITIHVAAYVAEVVRAGLTSIRKGQSQAGLAIGMSSSQILRHILLPQAIVRMLPALGSIISVTIKDTAIAAVIAVPELMRQARLSQDRLTAQ